MEESVGRITTKILEDAEKKSAEIIEAAEKEARERVEASKNKGGSAKERLIKEAERASEQAKKKIIAEAKIKARTILLEAKERLIKEAFTAAEEELSNLPSDKKYPDVLYKLAVETCIQFGGQGELEIIVRKEDEKILSKELKKMEKEIKKETGKDEKISLSPSDMNPGVMVKGLNGRVVIDSTFQNRLELLRPELRLRIAEVLFP